MSAENRKQKTENEEACTVSMLQWAPPGVRKFAVTVLDNSATAINQCSRLILCADQFVNMARPEINSAQCAHCSDSRCVQSPSNVTTL